MTPNPHELGQLQTLGIEGLQVRYPGGPRQAAIDQLDAELAILNQAGLIKWLLAAADFGRFAQAEGIFCRLVGHNPSPMLAYLLGLSDVDPLPYQLPIGPLGESEKPGIPEIMFAVDPWYAKPVADFVHKRCERDMVEEEIRLTRLHVENPTPYHVLDMACRETGVADGRFLFRAASQWELLPALVAKMIESVTNPLFDLAGIPLDDMPTFELIRQGCDLEVYPPNWDEWDLWTVRVPKAIRIEDIAAVCGRRDSQLTAYAAVSSAINTYQVVYLRIHYPLEFGEAIQLRWPTVPDEDEF